MKKLAILLACALISTSFTACSLFEREEEVEVTPTPEATEIPKVEEDIEDDVQDMEDDTMNTNTIDTYKSAIKDVYGDDYIPDKEMDETEIEEKLGISSEFYDEIWVEGSTLEENPDIFVVVKAKDGKTEEVEKALESYKTSLSENTLYEANMDKINAGEVYTNGDYVFFMILGANTFEDDTDLAERFKEETQKGLDAIKEFFE
ncbi:MAG: DUF4358 domain-containing protein [Clostridia bacterium]